MGNGSVIRPGDVQRMSAGTGVKHSEFNASQTERVHFLQIWFLPNLSGIRRATNKSTFSDDEKRGKLRLMSSPDGVGVRENSPDASILAGLFDGDEKPERRSLDPQAAHLTSMWPAAMWR